MKTRREIIAGGIAALGLPFLSNANPIRSMLGAEGVQGIQDSDDSISAASYVQDGLFAQWDGIENAGYGVHDSTATTWINLKGNPTISNLMFGYNYAMPTAGAPFTDGRLTDYRITGDFSLHGCLVTCPWVWYNWTMVGIGTGAGLENGICFCGRDGVVSGKVCYRKAYSGAVLNSVSTGIGINQFCTIDIIFSYETKAYSVWLNGEYCGETTITEADWNLDGVNVSIGCHFQRYTGMGDFRLHDILYYRRMLTPEEISYNNLLDRYRFGIS